MARGVADADFDERLAQALAAGITVEAFERDSRRLSSSQSGPKVAQFVGSADSPMARGFADVDFDERLALALSAGLTFEEALESACSIVTQCAGRASAPTARCCADITSDEILARALSLGLTWDEALESACGSGSWMSTGIDHAATPSQKNTQAFVVEPAQPLTSLRQHFTCEAFLQQVDELHGRGFHQWRPVLGDGNCFYRAVGFGLLEQIARSAADPTAQLVEWANMFCSLLAGLRFNDPAEACDHADLLHLVGEIRRRPLDAGRILYEVMADKSCPEDFAMVRAIRVLVARNLLDNASKDQCDGLSYDLVATSSGFDSVQDYCNKEVLTMGAWAGDLVLSAVPGALGADLNVACMTREQLYFERFPALCPEDFGHVCPAVHVLLKQSHYDLLYPSF